ncbi:MAG TPA: adenylate/guanylate cyclase domain-containing protein [Solirubrobacteraceae bacterium]|jgi:class 3 adenylate cyclase
MQASVTEGHGDGETITAGADRGVRRSWVAASWILAGALPLIGLISLLLRSKLDPHWENPKLHFVVFAAVGSLAFGLAYVAGEAATRRGDARVLLISLAFLATGGFLGLHAIGTPGILFSGELSGFKVAIPVGLLVSAVFGFASAFVDLNAEYAAMVMRRRSLLRGIVVGVMVLWFIWTVAKLAPLDRATSEGATGSLLGVLAVLGVITYGVSAARYWIVYRSSMSLLPASVIACFVLLAEAMIGVATTGERSWHASWWEWHALIVLAYVIIGFAARREWREERFRHLYLPSTRHRSQNVSVLFSDLAGFTSFTERSSADEVATLLSSYYELATPLITRRFKGEIEKFMGDGMMATFNSRGDLPDHAVRAARAGLALQAEIGRVADEHPGWPRLRVGINSGEAVLRELGGHGHVTYTLIGDTVNLGARLEGKAPVGAVMIGAETYRQLPDGAIVEAMSGVMVKGKQAALEAYVLHALPT